MAEDGEITPGRRKDGKPYKDGNTRPDGSYAVGKGRTSESTRFGKDDGRLRGRRAKGTRNLQTDWAEELGEKVEVTEGGKRKRITKQRGIVKAIAARAMKGSDRAAEIAFRHAGERDARVGRIKLEDKEIIARFVARHYGGLADEPKLLGDPYPDEERGSDDPVAAHEDGGPADANQ